MASISSITDVSVYTLLEVRDPSDIGDVSFTDDSYYIVPRW